MLKATFGNLYEDHWVFMTRYDGFSESLEVSGELTAGFFHAATPMAFTPLEIRGFAEAIDNMHRTLSGTALLQCVGPPSDIRWELVATPLGHVQSTGAIHISDNSLSFNLRGDQTSLPALSRWAWKTLAIIDHPSFVNPISEDL